jgi:hypothetical protein
MSAEISKGPIINSCHSSFLISFFACATATVISNLTTRNQILPVIVRNSPLINRPGNISNLPVIIDSLQGHITTTFLGIFPTE